jgi:hypothetical protein
VIDPARPGDAVLGLLAESHLATMTPLHAGGAPHVSAIDRAGDVDPAPAETIVRVADPTSTATSTVGYAGRRIL